MKYLAVALFLLLLCGAFSSSNPLLLQFPGSCIDLSYDLVYQRGSQVYVRMVYPEIEDCGSLDLTGAIKRKLVEINAPSVAVILTIVLPEPGENPEIDEYWRDVLDEPQEGDRILYENGSWVADYVVDSDNSWVNSYEFSVSVSMKNYPWVYVANMGYIYVTDEISPDITDGYTEARVSRWMYHADIGWFYSVGVFPVSIGSNPHFFD